MRVRLQSSLPDVVLGCWYEIPQDSKNAYVEDLILQLHSDLDLNFPSTELGLELEEFALPRRSRIEGVLREGDILNVKHNQESRPFQRSATIENQLVSHGDQLYTASKRRLLDTRNSSATREDRSIGRVDLDNSKVAAFEVNSDDEWDSDTTSTNKLNMIKLRREIRRYRSKHTDLELDLQRTKEMVEALREAKRLLEVKAESLAFDYELLFETNEELHDKLRERKMEITELKERLHPNDDQLSRFIKVQDEIIEKNQESRRLHVMHKQCNTISSQKKDAEESSPFITTESSADNIDSPCSSSSTSSSTSSSSSSSSSGVEELSSRAPATAQIPLPKAPITHIVPGHGSAGTATRNDRRKRKRTLERLIEAGALPEGSNFKTLEEYNIAREEGTLPDWQKAVFTAAPNKSPQVDGKSSTWDYPSEPEKGWEQRLVVKEVECESLRTEKRLPVKQVTEDGRDRKRLRGEESPIVEMPTQRQRVEVYEGSSGDVIIDADMYGEAEVVVDQTVNGNGIITVPRPDKSDLEEGQLESDEASESDSSMSDSSSSSSSSSDHDSVDVLAGQVPSLPTDISALSNLELSSEYLNRPGAVIAFKHLEMVNFRPSFSTYKTGRILKVKDDSLVLLLADADVQEPMYDYEGDRVPGPFDYWNEDGMLVEGQVEIPRHQLLDILLVSA